MAPTGSHDRLERRLNRLLIRTRMRVLGRGLARCAALLAAPVLLASWALGGEHAPAPFFAGGLAIVLVVAALLALGDWLVRPLLALRHRRDLVRHIETRGSFGNTLVATEESLRRPERWPDGVGVGAVLRRRVLERAERALDVVTPALILPPWQRGRVVSALVLALLLGLGLGWQAPADLARGAARLAPPWQDSERLPVGGLYAVAGPRFVVAGRTLDVEAVDFAGGADVAQCEVRIGSGLWQPIAARSLAVADGRPGLRAPFRRWRTELRDVHEDLVWRFRRGSLVTAPQTVAVRHHPLVTTLAARILPPAYTRLPAQDIPRLPTALAVPAGSELELRATLSHEIVRATLLPAGAEPLTMARDSLAATGRLPVRDDVVFTLDLEDRHGLRNQNPLQYQLRAVPDDAPTVRLTRLADDGLLPISGDVQLQAEAADDYGLTTLALLVRIRARDEAVDATEGTFARRVIWTAGEAKDAGARSADTPWGTYTWRPERTDDGRDDLAVALDLGLQMADLALVAGDALELAVEAVDNRHPGPAGTTRSRVLRLVLPSAADVLAQHADDEDEAQSALEEMRRLSGQLGQDLDRLSRELLKNPLPDWTRQQEMEAAIRRQQALQDELTDIAGQLEQNLDELAASQLTSPEMLDKAAEMSEVLSSARSDELQDLMRRLANEEGQVDAAEVADAIREVARQQQEMARRLDAALAMLDRMQREQELEGLASLLAQMIQKQQELADLSREMAQADEDAAAPAEDAATDEDSAATDGEGSEKTAPSTEPDRAQELARRQEALAQEMAELQEKLEDAIAALEEERHEEGSERDAGDEKWREALEQALEQVKQQQAQGDMDQASRQLQQMNPQQAAQLQEQALRDLGALYHVFLEGQQAMQMAMQMQQVSSLRGLAADLLALSARQEEIGLMVPAELRDLRTRDLAREQHRLQQAAVQIRAGLAELLEESPMRIMRLLAKLDAIIEDMGHGVRALEESRGPVARRHALSSLAESNRLVISLLTEAQMAGGGGGGGGQPMPSLGERLQEMLKEQARLNGDTAALRRMLADRGMSQAARAQMKRLGESQGELAGRMRELDTEERDRPEGERLLGDLAELGQDMEGVAEDVGQGLVSEETLVRQERILSRMLDARNSVRRRDYTDRREARTALEVERAQEGAVGAGDLDGLEDPRRLRYESLDRAPAAYRDLVRRYFAALDSLRAAAPEAGRRLDRGELP